MCCVNVTNKISQLFVFSGLSALDSVQLAAWRSGYVVRRINEVTLRRARLVLGMGWVTVFGRQTTSVFHEATQANSASYTQRDGK